MRLTHLLTAVDLHAAGEPGRVITGGALPTQPAAGGALPTQPAAGGVLDVPGETMYAKMKYFAAHHDDIRLRMLREPRGYPAQNCNLILPPSSAARAERPEVQAGYIIMEQAEYPPMSGTNTICVVTALLEMGILPMIEPVTHLVLEAPAGLIDVRADCQAGKVTLVTFRNVPAFAVHLDVRVEVPHLGTATVDVAWGGMFYAIADAAQFGLSLTPDEGRDIVRISEMVKAATREQWPVSHPDNPDVTGPTIAQLSAPPTRPGAHRKNVVTVSTGQLDWDAPSTWTGVIDRSPCGTGTCAKMAVLHAKRQLGLNEDFLHEGILGTLFTGRLVAETRVGPYPAVVPTLSGTAWITGLAQYVLDPDDPFPNGFTLGDIWGKG